jgi:hypothetical protein
VEPPESARWKSPNARTQALAWLTMSIPTASMARSASSLSTTWPGRRGVAGMSSMMS